jgi:hypothetical protein
MAMIQDFRDGTAGIHVRIPEIKVQVADDTDAPGERVLQVIYPASTDDPAGRDVWRDAIDTDWRVGHAIHFRAKPAQPVRLSVSFSWWQSGRIHQLGRFERGRVADCEDRAR